MSGDNFSIKIITIILVSILIGLSMGYVITVNSVEPADTQDKKTGENDSKVILNEVGGEETLWDPSHHTLIDLHGKVTGRVIMIEKFVEDERDQYHFLVLPDIDFKNMVNDENINQLRGAIMCEILKTDEYILPQLYIGQHLEIQGPHVTDISENHGYNEIDPVRVIIEI